jgi:hypothetical protein
MNCLFRCDLGTIACRQLTIMKILFSQKFNARLVKFVITEMNFFGKKEN